MLNGIRAARSVVWLGVNEAFIERGSQNSSNHPYVVDDYTITYNI